jgi:diketogulonate reductase-like aldo/keto reductase
MRSQLHGSMPALSSNFKEGQTKHIGVSNDELYGDALVKGNDWEDIWD